MKKRGRPIGTYKHIHPARMNGKTTKTYQTWSGMIQRCHGKHPANRYYKDMGITVCDRWRENYSNFVEDVGVAPEGCWIDRIDNSKNYEPGNVRWVTPYQSSQNRSKPNRYKPMSIKNICETLGIAYMKVYQRLKAGWSYEKAFTHNL